MADTPKSGQSVATETTDPFYSSTMQNLIQQLLASISDPRELANYPVWKDPKTGKPYSLVAKEDPYETAAYRGIAGLTSPEQFAQASNIYRQLAATDPTLFGEASQLASPRALGAYGGPESVGAAGKFGAQQAQQYMSPYMKGVTDIAIRNAREEEARQRAEAGLAAARGGGYGGGRAAIADAMRAMGLQRAVGDITAEQQQKAFENAQAQYERDRAARLAYGQTNIGAAQKAYELNQATARQNAQQALDYFNANVAARENAYKLNEQARQFSQQQALNAASGLGALGTAKQTADLGRLSALQGIGLARRTQGQREIDAARNEYMNSRMWNLGNIQMALNAVRGYPLGSSTLNTAQVQQPSFANQAIGTIMGAAKTGWGWP